MKRIRSRMITGAWLLISDAIEKINLNGNYALYPCFDKLNMTACCQSEPVEDGLHITTC